jgi:RNA polymerase sigma-70 factor (ECF subfamily)
MASKPRSPVLQPLYRTALLADGAGLTDAELLEAFITRRDGAFFEALVRRHGPMVLAVCRRILHDPHDAEDAFQAAFLVLAQRAATVRPRELVGNWLYGVAYRTALGARRAAARRRARERPVNDMPHPQVKEEETWQELLPVLDRELARLPDKYRAPLVLCHLEGRTRKEAARHLGLPVGTVSGRVTTALRMLARRLRRHGLVLSGGVLAAALSPSTASASVPASLVAATVKATTLLAAGQAVPAAVSANVAALAQGAAKSMLLPKLKLVSAMVLAVTIVGGSAGVVTYRWLPADPVPILQPEVPATSSPRRVVLESDRERLQGTWVPLASEVGGIKKRGDDPKLRQWKLIFAGDRVTLPGGEGVPFRLDTTRQPKEMDIEVDEGPSPMRAIYEFEADKLKVSFIKGGERPTDFDTRKNESVLIVFRRRVMP